jgi:hypothetical protein
MDWMKQSEEMIKNWTEIQQKSWKNWMDMMQPDAMPSTPAEAWTKMISLWEESVKSSSAAQTEMVNLWVKNLNDVPGISKEMMTMFEQAQEMGQKLAGSQVQLWEGFFKAMKEMDLGSMPPSMEAESQKAFAAWQETAKKMMDAQSQWTTMFTNAQPAGKNKQTSQ